MISTIVSACLFAVSATPSAPPEADSESTPKKVQPPPNYSLSWGSILARQFSYLYVNKGLVHGNRFLGVPTAQNPMDMWVLQEIIMESRPDLIIETGTAHGGSALYMAMILDQVHPDGRIITIDISKDTPKKIARAKAFPVFEKYVTSIVSDSVADGLHRYLETATEGKARVLVTLDSDHSAQHVAKELERYHRYVTPGGYLVVQDTFIDSDPNHKETLLDEFVRPWHKEKVTDGTFAAVTRFLSEHEDFARDAYWEKFDFTFHPGGFLRRVDDTTRASNVEPPGEVVGPGL